MIYVGRELRAVSSSRNCEPALIDPRLRVDEQNPDFRGDGMSYWPSYSTIAPASRSAYLRWLESGCSWPEAYIGYAFLYFYGLERRVLHDARFDPAARAEIPSIVAEVERLLSIYDSNGSFSGYASSFLEFVRAEQRDLTPSSPSGFARVQGGEFPLGVRLAVGEIASNAQPLPADWAVAWIRSDPSLFLRTPAERCREEFDTLFRIRYRALYGEGIRLRKCKRRVQASYRPASASFMGELTWSTELPDVTSLAGPRGKLQELALECSEALAPLSRFVGRQPERRERLDAAALLPVELFDSGAPKAFQQLHERLDRKLESSESALFDAVDILEPWLPADGTKQRKKDAVTAAQVFARAGFGLEPDVRFGGERLGRMDRAVVFRLGADEHESPSSAYRAAAFLLDLSTLVSAADGSVSAREEELLQERLASNLHLDSSEKRRLRAHLSRVLAEPPSITGLKSRLDSLSHMQRRDAARFLVHVAWADGHVNPDEVKALLKVYRLLGLDPGQVHEDIHSIRPGLAPAEDPVLVRAAEPAKAFKIPEPATDSARRASGAADESRVELDMSAIERKLEETAAVSALLAGVFVDEEEVADVVEVADESADEARVANLDPLHSRLFRSLGERNEWPRDDFEELVGSLGLLPDGAIERINEAAFERCAAPLTEGDDPLEVDLEVHREMIA